MVTGYNRSGRAAREEGQVMGIIKPKGQPAWPARHGKMHGSTAERRLGAILGKEARGNEKPRGTLRPPGKRGK